MTGMFTTQENQDRVARLRASAADLRHDANRARAAGAHPAADHLEWLADQDDQTADEIQADRDSLGHDHVRPDDRARSAYARRDPEECS